MKLQDLYSKSHKGKHLKKSKDKSVSWEDSFIGYRAGNQSKTKEKNVQLTSPPASGVGTSRNQPGAARSDS